jgi:hypothetical protein
VRRITAERAFAYLAEDIKRLRKSLATKTASLNEAERKQEVAQSKARELERESLDRALRSTRPTTYEITLKNASSPGLPSPLAFTNKGDAAGGGLASTATNDIDSSVDGRTPSEDIILDETVRILADYVDLLKPSVEHDARDTPRHSPGRAWATRH